MPARCLPGTPTVLGGPAPPHCNTSGVTSSLSTKIMARERDIINIASYIDEHAILNFGE